MNKKARVRLERAKKLLDNVEILVALSFWEDGERTVDAGFLCTSAAYPSVRYTGSIGFNGTLTRALCSCRDMDPYHDMTQAPLVDGIQVCKHSLAAALKLGWTPSGPAGDH